MGSVGSYFNSGFASVILYEVSNTGLNKKVVPIGLFTPVKSRSNTSSQVV